ncbi:MAG: glycosyltransferase family 9 protein, partial [Simkaniaceae bacterium]|nr:glycosyltransferase family 9 protein [Simkaniaceae bacterium]
MTSYLIVKTSSIGDIVQALCLLPYLAEKGTVDWAVEKKFASLLEGNRYIRRVISVNRGKFWEFPRDENYDAIFDLQGNCKSALFTLRAKGKAKVGFSLKSVSEWPNILVTNRRFTIDYKLPIQMQYLTLVANFFGQRPELKIPEKTVIEGPLMICPGSNWENKRLAIQTWISILKKLEKKCIIVWGSEIERGIAEQIAGNVGKMCQTLGGLSFLQWQEKMRECSGVISVDSCALHLAAALGVPTFSLFGPSSAKIYAPIGLIHSNMQGSC